MSHLPRNASETLRAHAALHIHDTDVDAGESSNNANAEALMDTKQCRTKSEELRASCERDKKKRPRESDSKIKGAENDKRKSQSANLSGLSGGKLDVCKSATPDLCKIANASQSNSTSTGNQPVSDKNKEHVTYSCDKRLSPCNSKLMCKDVQRKPSKVEDSNTPVPSNDVAKGSDSNCSSSPANGLGSPKTSVNVERKTNSEAVINIDMNIDTIKKGSSISIPTGSGTITIASSNDAVALVTGAPSGKTSMSASNCDDLFIVASQAKLSSE